MTQQVPVDNNTFPQQGGNSAAMNGGYVDVALDSYAPPQASPLASTNYHDLQEGYPQWDGGGHRQPPQGQQTYVRNTVPMIDPIESAKLTPQILVLLVLSGLKRHWKWSLPMGLVLGLITAGCLYLAFPLQYSAKASIQIRAVRPEFLGGLSQRQGNYEEFVNTQFAFMRSPDVIDKALENIDVAQLPIVSKQKDKRDWLTKHLRVGRDGRSEIVAVSIETDTSDASEKIVNAVVNAYFDHIDNVAKTTDQQMLTNLHAERRRHQALAATLQDSISAMTREAAGAGALAGTDGMVGGLGQGESLVRDLRVAESQQVTLNATRLAIKERLESPTSIPSEFVKISDPSYTALLTEREEAVRYREELARVLRNERDPRLLQAKQAVEALDERIKQFGTSDDSGLLGILETIRIQEQLKLWSIDQELKMQDILVSELDKKLKQQLVDSADRAVKAAGIQFDRTQLHRVDSVLDRIEERILAVSSEQRAPGQITQLSNAITSTPNRFKQITTIGMGAAVFAFFPLFLSIAVERIKPRLYHVSQVRRSVPHVLIGEIMEPPISWIQGATFRKRLARYRESVHNWCTHLLLSDPFRSCRTLSIASVAGDDGKTFLALQIAVAMAQMKPGKVLIIDGDMRVGRLHLLFGNEETGLGLADVLSFRNLPWEVIGQNEKEQNLELMTAGQLDVTPYELLGDGRFRELLDALEWSPSNPSGYSLIIVVLPPVANAAEALIMAASTDSTLLCVRQRETVLAAMEDVYRKLVNTGASVDGIVVKDIPYYQMASRDGGFADKLEQIRLSHLLQYAD